jgi:hypothetical protein
MKNFRKSKISALFKKSNKVPEISESEYYNIEKDFAKLLEGNNLSSYKYDSEDIIEHSEDVIEKENKNEEEVSLKKNLDEKEGSLVFGDSQSGLGIGKALSSNRIPFVGYNVNRIKNEVWRNDRLRKEISLANIIYICGGGNPQPSGAGNDAAEIIRLIRKDLSDAPIVWIAPPPPAFDGSAKGFSSMYDPGMDLYNKTVEGRKDRAYDIEDKLSSFPNVAVVNPFKFITSGGRPGYYCGGKCDGIHAPSNVANKIAQKALSAEVN